MKLASATSQGLYANRPAYGISGRLYYATDQLKLYMDTGSAWEEIKTTVAARYTTNSANTLTNAANTRIDFEDKDYDTHDAVTTGASWVFTAPFDGYYNISVSVIIDSSNAWAATEVAQLEIFSAGSRVSVFERFTSESSTAKYIQVYGSDTIYIAKNNTAHVEIYQDSGGSRGLYTNTGAEDHSRISIFMV